MIGRRALLVGVGFGVIASNTSAQTPASRVFRANHPDYETALSHLTGRRWAELIAIVGALPPQSACQLLEDLGDGAPIAENLNALSRARGGRGVAGAIAVGWAWRYRGAEVDIADEGGFVRWLETALEALMRAVEEDGNDGVSAAFLFRALKAIGEKDALQSVLQRFLAAQRRPVGGLATYADAISAKWVGSEAEALAFGRQHARTLAPASYGLIAEVHITSAVARTMSDDPTIVQSAARYMTQPAVASEIVAAHESFQASPPDADRMAMLLAHSQFSLAFMELNDAERARTHLLGQGRFCGGPWGDMPDPSAILSQARRAVGLGDA